jgi:hypothetical protein
MAHDCQPYWLRDQDTWTKIDYKASAKTWMKPLERGNETGMVEIPASWDVSQSLDDRRTQSVFTRAKQQLDDLPPLSTSR